MYFLHTTVSVIILAFNSKIYSIKLSYEVDKVDDLSKQSDNCVQI